MESKNEYGLEGKQKHMYDALYASLGNVSAAVKQTGIGRTTHYKWYHEDENYKQAVDELDTVTLDFVEDKLLKKIKNGDRTCIIFFLKTKGKQRGYVEKQEHEHSGNMNQDSTVRVEMVDAKEVEQDEQGANQE